MLPAPGFGHALINSDLQIQFPALPLVVGTVLPVGHGVTLLLLFLWLHNRQSVLHAQLVRGRPECFNRLLVAVVLFPGVTAHGVDHEVRMDVLSIRVGCNDNFKARHLLRQPQGNFMGHLRRNRIIWMEGLHHVIVHPSAGAFVLPFGIHKFLQGTLWNAVDAGHQRPSLVGDLRFFTAVVKDTLQTASGLGSLVFYKVYDCHATTASA